MKKILFIKRGSFSYINRSVAKLLRREFPECELEIVDIREDLLAKKTGLRLLNWIAVLWNYLPQILSRTHPPQACFLRTPFLARSIHQRMSDLLSSSPEDYLFSFQTSSLYDASIPGIPHFVFTDHTHKTNYYYPSFDNRKFFSDYWVDEELKIYENARRVFTMSEHVRKSCLEHYQIDPDKVQCVFGGSNAEADPQALENDEYSNQRISFIGVDWERKGGPELVEAFRQVLKTHPNAQLDIVGCTPTLDCPNVNVVGRVPLEQVQSWFCKSSVFCVPTKVEPFGIVFVEALAHQLPVVSSNLGALPQIVEHGKSGYLCDPEDTNKMAGYLSDLLGSPETCKQFGEYGYQRVQKVLNWEAVGKVLSSAIRQALATSNN